MVANAIIIKKGISNNRLWSLFKKILSIAGSNSHAVADVLAATKIEKKTASKILLKYFLV